MAIAKNPELTGKRIIEVAQKMQTMPVLTSQGAKDKWFLENLGDLTIREMDAALMIMDTADSLAEMINKQIPK